MNSISRHPQQIPALDGIRGVAVFWVILFHATQHAQFGDLAPWWERWAHPLLRYGWAGVDIFFVLSGFLITRILLHARSKENYFRNFYARRTLRIFPLYYACLLFALFVLPWLWNYPGLTDYEKGWAWYFSYLQNWGVFFQQLDPGAQGILGHLWSLAVEEQFYIVWPWLVWRSAPRKLVWVCVLFVLAGPFVRAGMLLTGSDPLAVYTSTLARSDSLLAGALIAILLHLGWKTECLQSWAKRIVACSLLGLLGLYVVMGSVTFINKVVLVLGPSLNLALAIGLVLLAVQAPGSCIARFFSVSPLRWLGKYSYALYVFHAPVMLWLDAWLGGRRFAESSALNYIVFVLLAGVASLVLALLSWNLLERNFLRLKRYF